MGPVAHAVPVEGFGTGPPGGREPEDVEVVAPVGCPVEGVVLGEARSGRRLVAPGQPLGPRQEERERENAHSRLTGRDCRGRPSSMLVFALRHAAYTEESKTQLDGSRTLSRIEHRFTGGYQHSLGRGTEIQYGRPWHTIRLLDAAEAEGHRTARPPAPSACRAVGTRARRTDGVFRELHLPARNGFVSPSIGSMQKIASTLGVTLGEFFTQAGQGASGVIVRARDRARFASQWSNADLESAGASRRLEVVIIHLEVGGRTGSSPTATTAPRTMLTCSRVRSDAPGPDSEVLRTGDAVGPPRRAAPLG